MKLTTPPHRNRQIVISPPPPHPTHSLTSPSPTPPPPSLPRPYLPPVTMNSSTPRHSTMLFVQTPSALPSPSSATRRPPPRCPPTMIRSAPPRSVAAPPSTRVTAVPVAAPTTTASPSAAPSTNSPPSTATDKAPKPRTSKRRVKSAVAAEEHLTNTTQAPQVKAAAVAVHAAAVSKSKVGSTAFESQERFMSRASGRNQKYVRDSIENDRPAATSIAEMVAPDMMGGHRELYFDQASYHSAEEADAAVSEMSPEQELAQLAAKKKLSQSTASDTSSHIRLRSRTRPATNNSHRHRRSQKEFPTDDDEAEEQDEQEPTTEDETTKVSGVKRAMDDTIRSYLSEIGKVKLLDSDMEVELARNIAKLLQLERLSAKLKRKNGVEPTMEQWAEASDMSLSTFRRTLRLGLRAKEHMVAANLRLVVSIAKKYTNRGLTFQDLIQEGSIGLIRGAEKFDANKGFKFSTYATWWIRQAITRAIADHSRPIRLPVHVNDTISSISKANKELQNEMGRPPTDEEVANTLKIPVAKLQFIMKSSRATISLETPMAKDGSRDGANLGSMIVWTGDSPDQTAEKTLLREDLETLLNTLTPRERDVVRMRYGFDDGRSKTLEEIGSTFAVTRERIRQIESKALRKLRHPNRNANLRDYITTDL